MRSSKYVLLVAGVIVAFWALWFLFVWVAGAPADTTDGTPAGVTQQVQTVEEPLDPGMPPTTDAGVKLHCRKTSVIIRWHNKLGKDLFAAKWTERWCYDGVFVNHVRPLRTECWTTGLGEFFGWTCGIAAARPNGSYQNGHRSHVAWSKVHFHQCSGIGDGCVGINDLYVTGIFHVLARGGILFNTK